VTHQHDPDAALWDERVPREGPYRIVLARLARLVHYRQQLLAVPEGDSKHPASAAELVRVRHMIREVHRAVSINVDATLLAQAIDPGEAAMAPPLARPSPN
jgi:hypothetical protein